MSQITTVSFFHYTTFLNKYWGFKMMRLAMPSLKKIKGSSFSKLMGSGRDDGFNNNPDWSAYCLIQVWDKEENALAFFKHSELMTGFRMHTFEIWTLYLKSISTKGEWSAQQPFQVSSTIDTTNLFIGVITRATIKWNYLRKFWNSVPKSHIALENNKDLVFSKGIGEILFLQIATFTLWNNLDAMKKFAYKSSEHSEVIKKTREFEWFDEELFSRFQPYLSVGTWNGLNPLPELK